MSRPQAKIEIPWKEWLHGEAAKLGIKPHTLNIRIIRKTYPAPGIVKRGPSGRAIAVVLLVPKLEIA